MVRILTIFKARRLLNIDLFLDWSIEEGTFHVHLIKLKAMVSVTPRDPQTPRDATGLHYQHPNTKKIKFGSVSFVFISIAEAKEIYQYKMNHTSMI
jgi:hypothetical protein